MSDELTPYQNELLTRWRKPNYISMKKGIGKAPENKPSPFKSISRMGAEGIGTITNTYPKLNPYEFYKRYLMDTVAAVSGRIEVEGFRRYAEFFLEHTHVIELDARLVPLIEATDNKVFHRPLFFDNLFVNAEFHVGDYILRGIGIIEKQKDWAIFTSVLHVPTNKGAIVFNYLINHEDIDYGDPMLNKEIKRIAQHLRVMACNFIDLVESNDKDIEVTRITPTAAQQQKRAERKKPKLPTKVYIRPAQRFIEYLKAYKADSESKTFGHKFEVRGHFRHYRHEKYSEKLKSTAQWIKPYWKGDGMATAKVYKVM